ncbi:MAG TPA: S8 family serine peptidase [Gemmatimonadales bacterium]
MRRLLVSATVLALACAPSPKDTPPPTPKPNIDPGAVPPSPPKPNIDPGARNPRAAKLPPDAIAPPPEDSVRRVAPPQVAFAHGWMPLASTGVDRFLRAHPDYDGRGVLIGILDTGIDPSVPGLGSTTTGSPKVLDVRDFSDEGAVTLERVTPTGDSVTVGGRRLGGFGRLAGLSAAGPYFGGTIAELPLGEPPAADLNRNGKVGDTLAVLVTRASDGWVLFADTDGDGSLANEKPVHDYLAGRETFGWAPRGLTPRVSVAVNFGEAAAAPSLDLVFDITGHGTHVAGIAAAHDIYGVSGFDGVAPGAQLLGLKIANGANGGITTTGSMLRAMDYAIKFAQERRLPLVLNMSFGVGNEIEGGARIDALVDSVLQAHPDLVMAISVGNDGPGLSSLGFPGSAGGAISIAATLPSSFLAPGPNGAPLSDQLAYFSSRGGEVAKPDLATPGMAYSTVPRWNAGDEVEQGTSMASPHASGLIALLVSGLTQTRKPIDARAIRQAMMVTAAPTSGMTYLDEGTGVPDVGRAWSWLESGYPVPDIKVKAIGRGDVSGAIRRGAPISRDTVQTFELIRPASAAKATYTLRSDAPWLIAPSSVTLAGEKTRVDLRYAKEALGEPGAHIGVVSGWSDDTLAGPAFRLVNAVVVAAPVSQDSLTLRSSERVPPGGLLRTFFRADSLRPFALTVATGSRAERALAFLHEPDGMPFRDEGARPAGYDQQSAEYEADARDVVSGAYECIVVGLPGQSTSATVALVQSPLALHASRQGGAGVRATFANLTKAPVTAEVGLHLGGAERDEAVTASGSKPVRIPFVMPAWARGVVVDITMDRAQWGRFTDFGATLLDSAGKQLGKKPLNYAFGRLQVEAEPGHSDTPVALMLLPGFADPADTSKWSLRASIRLYADSSVVLGSTAAGSTITIAPGKSVVSSFTMPSDPRPLGEKFVPLGLLIARVDGRSWTRETPLASGSAASGQ